AGYLHFDQVLHRCQSDRRQQSRRVCPDSFLRPILGTLTSLRRCFCPLCFLRACFTWKASTLCPLGDRISRPCKRFLSEPGSPSLTRSRSRSNSLAPSLAQSHFPPKATQVTTTAR